MPAPSSTSMASSKTGKERGEVGFLLQGQAHPLFVVRHDHARVVTRYRRDHARKSSAAELLRTLQVHSWSLVPLIRAFWGRERIVRAGNPLLVGRDRAWRVVFGFVVVLLRRHRQRALTARRSCSRPIFDRPGTSSRFASS